MKNAIIIKTHDLPIVVEVANFKKENCIFAIGATLRVAPTSIEQVSASPSNGIYAIKDRFADLDGIVTNPVLMTNFAHTIEVEYAKLT